MTIPSCPFLTSLNLEIISLKLINLTPSLQALPPLLVASKQANMTQKKKKCAEKFISLKKPARWEKQQSDDGFHFYRISCCVGVIYLPFFILSHSSPEREKTNSFRFFFVEIVTLKLHSSCTTYLLCRRARSESNCRGLSFAQMFSFGPNKIIINFFHHITLLFLLFCRVFNAARWFL